MPRGQSSSEARREKRKVGGLSERAKCASLGVHEVPFMSARRLPLLLLFLLIELLCSAPSARAANTNVSIANFSFTPSVVNVSVGDTVTWVKVSGTHTVDPLCGANVVIATSQSVTFNTPGSFAYHCDFHASMTGLVVVAAASAPPTVSITAPTNGAKFFSGTTFPFTFSTASANSTVTKVELFDSNGVVFALSPPFTTNFPASGFGSHTGFAVATDAGGLTGTSAPVTLHILSTNVTLIPVTAGALSFTVSNTAAGHSYAFDVLTNFSGPLGSR